MENQYFKRLNIRLSSKIRRQCACCLLAILMLLASNTGLIPNAYAASASGTANSIQASSTSGNSGTVASTQNGSVTGNVYTGQNASIIPFDIQKALTESVYSDNPDIVDKAIDYPAIPSRYYSTDKKVYQSGAIHIRHVIHMPRVRRRSQSGASTVTSSVYGSAYATPNTPAIAAGQNPATGQNSNNSSVASSVYSSPGTSLALPNSLVITGLSEGVDEADLSLLDSGQSQNESSVVSTVYSGDNPAFPIQNKAGHFTVGFSRRTGSSLFRFSYKNASLTLSPLNPAAVSGSVYNNSISYAEIYPGTDLKYTVKQDSLKEELTLKKYTGKSDFLFQLGVSNAVYKIMSDSTIIFDDPTSGQPLFYMPRPFAVDKNGKRIDLTIEFTNNGLLEVSIDPNWLKSAAYPIVIDPTIDLYDASSPALPPPTPWKAPKWPAIPPATSRPSSTRGS